jgi:NAD(P)-dependent dehydrogenase (short-subunit alcohol dehydrogenase family)
MKILVIGGTGTIGAAVVAALKPSHEVISVTRKTQPGVDISDPASIRALYERVGQVDAVVSCAGAAQFKPLDKLSDDDFQFTLKNKLMGQVNLVRYGFAHVRDKGSFTLTSGVLAKSPIVGSGAISLVNCGLEGFARAAALEAPRGIRVNVVSPPWVTETLIAFKMDPKTGMPAAKVAQAYVKSAAGLMTGQVIEP